MDDGRPSERHYRTSPRLALLAGTVLSWPSAAHAAIDPADWVPRLDPHNAIGFAFTAGVVIFATVVAFRHVRERDRWVERERAMAAELAALRGAQDRADILTGAERQVVVAWAGRDSEPVIEGDPSAVAEGATARRVLAFGSWASAIDAAALDTVVERLKERGEAFLLTARTLAGRFVEAEGRVAGGRAILRLRDVTGDRHELMSVRRDLVAAQARAASMQNLIDAIPQPMWQRDPDGRLAWANAAYVAAVEAADLDDARTRGLELLDRTSRDEAARKRRDGERFEARIATVVGGARRILDVMESPTGAGIAVDASELEAVRADLQRQMEAHVRTLDQLPTAVAIFDSRQRLVFHNAAYRQLWDLDQAFLESRPLDGEILDRLRSQRRLPEQADYRTWKTAVLSAYRSPEPQETWWHLPDRRTLRVVTNPGAQGGVTYLFDDVSDRIHLESQYNALIRVQGETLDTLKEGVAVFGTDGRLKLGNRAFVEMWRLPEGVVAKQPHIDEIMRLGRPLAPEEEAWVDLRGAVAGLPDMRMGLTCRMERRDGTVLDCAAQPLPDGATLLTFSDVTASVNVERALTEKNDALERAARLRDDFVHHVSYELRSPLTNIIGFTQLLGDETVGALNTRQKDYASHIMRSSGALLAIINDILDLASIDTGSLELNREEVDIRDTIDAAVRGVEDRIAEASLTLEIDAPQEMGSFMADGKRVRQVLFNLLSNAIGFSSPGQTVRVAATKSDSDVVFRVTDQGRGIPPEVRARVFERFESHTLGTRHRGVGLGLAIVRSFVELHGGQVELDSSPGAGTTVTCTFPIDSPHSLAAE